MARILVILNTTGRQAASIARVASAVGFSVRAHVADAHHSPLVAGELTELQNTTLFTGNLANPVFLRQLFNGAHCAFVNTTAFDDEVRIGKACVDLALQSQVQHVVYSSMPDHNAGDIEKKGWPSLPQWKGKAEVEQYAIEKLGARVTIVHTGIYYNNFTTLPYPLFQMREVQLGPGGQWENGEVPQNNNGRNNNGPSRKEGNLGFEWNAPFSADVKLPWLDCEHDFGPAILQIFKDGPKKWGKKRVPIAFDYLTPPEVCEAFSLALGIPTRYTEGPVYIEVPIPAGYAEELDTLQKALGGRTVSGFDAPYWWTGFFDPVVPSNPSGNRHPGPVEQQGIIDVSQELWPGWRSMADYAGDAFVVEERHNGKTWMDSDESAEVSEDEEDDEGLELAAARPL